MANNYRKIDAEELITYAEKYIDECEAHLSDAATGKGVLQIKDRKVPTMDYWVLQWLKKQNFDFYTRQHVYRAIKNIEHPLCDTLKRIREVFDAVAVDIVANEGKGIFYAKNRLGMSDQQRIDSIQKITIERKDSINTGTSSTETNPI